MSGLVRLVLDCLGHRLSRLSALLESLKLSLPLGPDLRAQIRRRPWGTVPHGLLQNVEGHSDQHLPAVAWLLPPPVAPDPFLGSFHRTAPDFGQGPIAHEPES